MVDGIFLQKWTALQGFPWEMLRTSEKKIERQGSMPERSGTTVYSRENVSKDSGEIYGRIYASKLAENREIKILRRTEGADNARA
jgi:hypothetical protein